MEEDIKLVAFDTNGVLINKGVLNEDVLNIVKELKKKGFKLILCSNTSRKFFEMWDEKYDFLKYFDDIILAEDVQVNKPEPEFFSEILERNTNIQPQNILFIDDVEENVLSSEAEGLIGILFKDVATLKKDLEKLGLM